MKLNLEIIRSCLPDQEIIKSYGIETRKLVFNRPVLWEQDAKMLPGTLYILHTRDLPAAGPTPGCGVICIGERLPSAWYTGGAQVLWLPKETSVRKLSNRIHEIWNRFDAWDAGMRDELEKEEDFDLSRIMLLGSEMLENPTNVVGEMLQPIISIEYVETEEGGSFQAVSQPGILSAEHAELVKQVCNLERTLTVPYISSINFPGQQSYCNNLYPMGHFVGCVSITSRCRPFLERDFPLADHYFSVFRKAFSKYLRSYNMTQSSSAEALQKLMRHEPMTVEDYNQFQLGPEESWIFFALRGKKGATYLPKEYLYGTINTMFPHNIYVAMFHKEIVGVIRLTKQNGELLTVLSELIKRTDYIAGLSNPFREIERIDDYMLQANYTVNRAAEQQSEKTMHYFHDHALSYLLHACTSEMSVSSLVFDKILAMDAYDKEKGTEYVKTLDIFLRNEMSITKTAEMLYIHRSSLMKRLDRIYRKLDDDLSDPDRRLYYRICLALMMQE